MRLRRIALIVAGTLAAMTPSLAAFAQEDLPWQRGGGDTDYGNDTYRESAPSSGPYDSRDDGYGSGGYGQGNGDTRYAPRRDSFSDPGNDRGPGYGEPYREAPPPQAGYDRGYQPPPPYRQDQPTRMSRGTYEQGEIVRAGHSFFGSISEGLGSIIEYAFKSQGRPNGYILGQDAGGAFVLGLRYGEGRMYTKDAGEHPVFWQGPSVGYDAGAEGSKTMVLVYNMRDPSEIYHRFAGVQGAAYLVGGVSIQFQKYGDVMLGVIRSGVGLRLGANVGYLKYTRTPTWNPL
jgi:hypothetical protein